MSLLQGASVLFFPEGTRSKDRKMGGFKKGAFSVAVKAGVPIVPITLVGTGQWRTGIAAPALQTSRNTYWLCGNTPHPKRMLHLRNAQ